MQQFLKCSATTSYSKFVNDQSKSSVCDGGMSCIPVPRHSVYEYSFRYNLHKYLGPPEEHVLLRSGGGGGQCEVF